MYTGWLAYIKHTPLTHLTCTDESVLCSVCEYVLNSYTWTSIDAKRAMYDVLPMVAQQVAYLRPSNVADEFDSTVFCILGILMIPCAVSRRNKKRMDFRHEQLRAITDVGRVMHTKDNMVLPRFHRAVVYMLDNIGMSGAYSISYVVSVLVALLNGMTIVAYQSRFAVLASVADGMYDNMERLFHALLYHSEPFDSDRAWLIGAMSMVTRDPVGMVDKIRSSPRFVSGELSVHALTICDGIVSMYHLAVSMTTMWGVRRNTVHCRLVCPEVTCLIHTFNVALYIY